MPVIQGFANPLLLQTDIAVNDSRRAVLRASHATIEVNDHSLRSVHLALTKSSDVIATSRGPRRAAVRWRSTQPVIARRISRQARFIPIAALYGQHS